jgi:hypothetical protein
MRFFLIDRAIQEEGFYVYNMYNIVGEYHSISIKLERSRGGSLVSIIIVILYIALGF